MKKEHWLIISDQILKIKHFMTDTGRKVYTTDLLKLFELSLIKTFSVEKLNFFHLTGNYFCFNLNFIDLDSMYYF